LLNFFKSKLSDLEAAASRFNDRETAEGIVAVMTGTAYADGELEESEKKKLVGGFKINPILKQYDQSILFAKHRELAEQLEFDVDSGFDACLKELRDVVSRGASEEKRIAIMRMGVATAKADGEIEPAERTFLLKCASVLGVAADQVGL
jgi:tellurite resistance protein TerB